MASSVAYVDIKTMDLRSQSLICALYGTSAAQVHTRNVDMRNDPTRYTLSRHHPCADLLIESVTPVILSDFLVI